MSDTFSTAASHAFEHPELPEPAGPSSSSMGEAASELSIEDAFDVPSTIQLIMSGGYKTIGLQFPDELLPSSVTVYRAIQAGIAASGAQAYVLADSTYGSCCPDVLSCLHLPADLLVHYGHACLTPTDALPVHYVFPRGALDAHGAAESLRAASREEIEESSGRGVVVVWDVAYDWLAEDIISTFKSVCPAPISFATIQRPALLRASSEEKGKAPALRSIVPPAGLTMSDCIIWYIGSTNRSLLNLQMTHAANSLYAYSPSARTTTLQTTTSRLLSRRLFAVHSAIAADVFGLVVANIGLASSRPLLEELRRALKRAKKKSYTMSVGRLNPAKLANFAEVECFVLVGCAEGGVVDSKDFLRPIITPWELLLALEGPNADWEPNKWTLDMAKVLEEAKQRAALPKSMSNGKDVDEDADPEFSLITGSLRTKKTFSNGDADDAGLVDGARDLTLRNKEFSLQKFESAGSVYLKSRHFQGLEPRYGEDEPAVLEEGRSGIAKDYGEES